MKNEVKGFFFNTVWTILTLMFDTHDLNFVSSYYFIRRLKFLEWSPLRFRLCNFMSVQSFSRDNL